MTRVHAAVASAVAAGSALDLSGCIHSCAAYSGAEHLCKVWSSSSDLLFVLALLPVARSSTFRRVVVSVSDSFVELCGCATPHHMRCGTASQLTMCRPAQARAAEQCRSMPLSV